MSKNRDLPPIPIYVKPAAESESEIISNSLGITVGIIFLVIASLLFLSGNSQSQNLITFLDVFSINFTSIVLEAVPFMLIGTLIGGVIEVFVPIALIDRFFGKGKTQGVFLAGGLGLLFPTCECAIVPIVRRLILKGISIPAAVCFMLSGPIVNVIVAWSTAVAYTYNWKMVLLRISCGYVVAVLIGLVLSRFANPQKLILDNVAEQSFRGCGCGDEEFQKSRIWSKLLHAIGHARDDFLQVGKYLVIGAFIAAFIRTVTPVTSFAGLAESPWIVIFVMMVMAVLMNLCSEADAFIAASFRWLIPGSAQLGFMVLGPMLDLKLVLMYLSVFRKRTIALLAVLTFGVVYSLMLLIEIFLPPFV
ncbi:MAG: permease [Desulfocapsaceae bacterium]|nr:permease [Desulfocapsaceae bacterium]